MRIHISLPDGRSGVVWGNQLPNTRMPAWTITSVETDELQDLIGATVYSQKQNTAVEVINGSAWIVGNPHFPS